jgi:putative endonuclease
MIYTVYILFSELHKQIYIGQTSHLLKRFHSHNAYGKDWTRHFRPWSVIYCEYFDSRHMAMKRERQLKTATVRRMIWQKIEKEFKILGFMLKIRGRKVGAQDS